MCNDVNQLGNAKVFSFQLHRLITSMAKGEESLLLNILTEENLWLNITGISLRSLMPRNERLCMLKTHPQAATCTISSTSAKPTGKLKFPVIQALNAANSFLVFMQIYLFLMGTVIYEISWSAHTCSESLLYVWAMRNMTQSSVFWSSAQAMWRVVSAWMACSSAVVFCLNLSSCRMISFVWVARSWFGKQDGQAPWKRNISFNLHWVSLFLQSLTSTSIQALSFVLHLDSAIPGNRRLKQSKDFSFWGLCWLKNLPELIQFPCLAMLWLLFRNVTR